MTGQLIHAATDEHVWAKAYDRDLTEDIFAIQSELAEDGAGELKAALSPEEKAMLGRKAHGEHRGLRPLPQGAGQERYKDRRCVRAEGIPPEGRGPRPLICARVRGPLAHSYAFEAFHFHEGVDDLKAKAKDADRAMQLAPEDPEIISNRGTTITMPTATMSGPTRNINASPCSAPTTRASSSSPWTHPAPSGRGGQSRSQTSAVRRSSTSPTPHTSPRPWSRVRGGRQALLGVRRGEPQD